MFKCSSDGGSNREGKQVARSKVQMNFGTMCCMIEGAHLMDFCERVQKLGNCIFS